MRKKPNFRIRVPDLEYENSTDTLAYSLLYINFLSVDKIW